jgi:aryl-alcohol dehydrogenase-like predicted oxidoreductase
MHSWTFGDGQTVNRLGFGAMRLTGQPGNWGPYPDKARAERVFRRAYELGVNFIDTAISYGAGHSEMLIAELLRPYPKDLLIATKGGNVKTGPGQLHRDGTPGNMRASCEASLGYLKVEAIDLYQLHAVDPNVPLEETVGAMAQLKAEGKIRRVGLCNVSVEQLQRAQAIVAIESVQNKYNFSVRESQDVLDYCAGQRIAFLPWGPLGANAFARGAPLAEAGGPLDALAARLGARPSQVALAWLMAQGPHVIPIPGTTSVEHLEENVAAGDIALSAEELAALG